MIARGLLVLAVAGWAATSWESRRRYEADGRALRAAYRGLSLHGWPDRTNDVVRSIAVVNAALERRERRCPAI